MPGQLQEDVVERGTADGDVLDPDAGLVEPPHRFCDLSSPVGERKPKRSVLHERPPVADRGERGLRCLPAVAVVEPDLEPVAAHLLLELVGRALGDDDAAVDHGDPVGQAIRLVQVLGREEHGRPSGDELLDRVPEADPAADVEPRRGLVEEEHRRPRDERGGEVEAAAHASGVRPGEPPAGIDEVERGQELVGALREWRRPRW